MMCSPRGGSLAIVTAMRMKNEQYAKFSFIIVRFC